MNKLNKEELYHSVIMERMKKYALKRKEIREIKDLLDKKYQELEFYYKVLSADDLEMADKLVL